MLLRGNGTHVPSLTSQTATLVEATRSHVRRDVTAARSGAQRVDTLRVSGMASFMSRLKSLQEADPDRSRQVLTQIAGHVRERALATEGKAGDALTRFADKLQAAADTGDAVVFSRRTRHPADETRAIADKLETYADYQEAGAPDGVSDAFFEALTEALGRMIAGTTSDDTLVHLPEPPAEPAAETTEEAGPPPPSPGAGAPDAPSA